LFIHSFEDVRRFVFIIFRYWAIASHTMKINIKIANIDMIDPTEDTKFHVA